MSARLSILTPVLALAALIACDPAATEPIAPSSALADHRPAPVTLEWHQAARGLVAANSLSPLAAGRMFAALGMAQHQAIQAVNDQAGGGGGNSPGAGGRSEYEAHRGAVAGASARVLGFLVPAAATVLEQKLADQASSGPGRVHPQFTRGVAVGRGVGDAVVEHLMNDGFTRPFTGAMPVGAGYWTTAAPPGAGATLGAVTPWFLASPTQFRPAPPPAYLSPAFNADLAEVLTIASSASPVQIANAQWWNSPGGTHGPLGIWNELAGTYAADAALDEAAAAQLFALVGAAMFDALIACWEAKYYFWYLRPTHANPAIPLAYGLPNYPAYPSGHQSMSAAAARVLTHFFPGHAAAIEAMRAEASESRIIGGIHYRFDMDAGRTLGQGVADWVLQQAL
jgi:membrane-associated phospholipid phosphatase